MAIVSASIMPPAARRRSARSARRAPGRGPARASPGTRRGASSSSRPGQPASSSVRSIARIRLAFSGCGPVSCSSDDAWRSSRPIGPVDTVPAACATSPLRRARPRRRRRRRRSGGPPRRARGGRGGRAGRAGLAQAAGRERQLLGPGRPRRRDAPDDSPARHAEDTLNAGRGLCDPAAVEVLVSRVARGRRGADAAAGSASTSTPTASLALGLEGGHSARRIVHAGGAETGRALTSRLAELVGRQRTDRGARGRLGAGALIDGERCAGVITDARPAAGDRHGPGHRRRRGALEPDDQPARGDRSRRRSSPTPPAPSSPTSSSASSTRPRSRCRAASSTAG